MNSSCLVVPPRSVEEDSVLFWAILPLVYIFLALGSHFVLKRGWAKNRNALLGYRTIMAFRSQKTWEFANDVFFKCCFYISSISLLIHYVSFGVTEDFGTASTHSRLFFGICFLSLIVLLEIVLLIKFNWKGEPRRKRKTRRG